MSLVTHKRMVQRQKVPFEFLSWIPVSSKEDLHITLLYISLPTNTKCYYLHREFNDIKWKPKMHVYVYIHALNSGFSRLYFLISMGHITLLHRESVSSPWLDWHIQQGSLVVWHGECHPQCLGYCCCSIAIRSVFPQTFQISYLCNQTTELNSNVTSWVSQANHEDPLPLVHFWALIVPAVEVVALKSVEA